jgi:AcrR family transcriptional regulator
MARVAEEAGVSAGPRQYYFPTREDLFAAVIEHLIEGQIRWYALPEPEGSPEYRLRRVIDRSLEFTGTQEQVAMLEIRLALKHEDELEAHIGDRIREFEASNERRWLRMLSGTGRTDAEILTLRQILSAVSRGLAFVPPETEAERREIAATLYRLAVADGDWPSANRPWQC